MATTIDSADDGFAIVPSDVTDLEVVPRGIYVGVGGDITMTLAHSGTNLLFKNAQPGNVLPVRPLRVKASGTTATDLIGLY